MRLLSFLHFIFQTAEVPLQHNANALRRQGRLGEIAVVGLTVGFQAHIAILREEILDIEVADEVGGGGQRGFVTIAELPVEQQAVVEQASAEQGFHLHIVPPLVTRCQIGAQAPVVRLQGVADYFVELAAQGVADKGIDGVRCQLVYAVLTLRGCIVGIETPHS
mgnify:CR=1 FL=1